MSHLAGFTSESLPLVRGVALSAMDAARTSYCDIGANLNDEMYDGVYNEKRRHDNDLSFVLDRAKSLGVSKIICTAGTVVDSENALNMVSGPFGSPFGLYSTVGVHPTRCDEFKEDDAVIEKLQKIIEKGNPEGQPKKIVAIGECGLDYARLKFCSREQQLIGFQQQLDLAASANLPMFLHNRDTDGEFLRMIQETSTSCQKEASCIASMAAWKR